jgi:O-antigen ligase
VSTAAATSLALAPTRTARRTFPAQAPLYLLVLGFPIWWALGAAYFVWPLLTLPLLLSLLVRGNVRVPPRFGLWLLFLAWVFLSALEVNRTLSLLLLLYRASIYLSATVLFLYVFNAPRARLPDRTIVTMLALFWLEVVVGGFLGVLFPRVSFSTPVEHLLPASVLQDETARAFVHPAFAEVMTFLGYPVGRPKVLFAYSNQWGAALAVLTPFALAAISMLPRRPLARVLRVLLVLSIIPIVVSINRGLWLALGVGLAYAVLRLARRDMRALAFGLAGAALVVSLVFATPLGGLAHDRLTSTNNSNTTRLTVYQETIDQVKASPLLGYGSPHGQIDRHQEAHVGTQGQLFMVLYSHGVPGLVFFASWLGYALVRSGRGRGSPARFWAHVALLILLVEMPYYNYMPTTLHLIMVGAALAWRDIVDPRPEPATA